MKSTIYADNALEFLVRGGRSLAQAMMMLIPEAWDRDPLMPDAKKAFYQYHSCPSAYQ